MGFSILNHAISMKSVIFESNFLKMAFRDVTKQFGAISLPQYYDHRDCSFEKKSLSQLDRYHASDVRMFLRQSTHDFVVIPRNSMNYTSYVGCTKYLMSKIFKKISISRSNQMH